MSDFGNMADRVRNLKDDLRDGHKEATKESMGGLRAAVRLALRRNDSVARSVLIGNVQEDPQPPRTQDTITERSVHVPEFAKYLEKGTGSKGVGEFKAPSNPPYAAISEWAHAKPIVPRKYDTIDDAAAAIAQSIAEEGTIPHPFLDPAWNGPRGTRSIIDANVRAMRRALKRL